jgi:hypothetical protein
MILALEIGDSPSEQILQRGLKVGFVGYDYTTFRSLRKVFK